MWEFIAKKLFIYINAEVIAFQYNIQNRYIRQLNTNKLYKSVIIEKKLEQITNETASPNGIQKHLRLIFEVKIFRWKNVSVVLTE